MADILIRGLGEQTLLYISKSKGHQSRDSFLRTLITDCVEEDMVKQHYLMPNTVDMQHRCPHHAHQSLQSLYMAKLSSYPKTSSRYLSEQGWQDAAHVITQLRHIADSDEWVDGYHETLPSPRFFGCSLSGQDIDMLIDRLDTAIKRGCPPPPSLYNDTLVVDHQALTPVRYTSWPCRDDARAKAFTPQARTVYCDLARSFIMCHWNLLDKLPGTGKNIMNMEGYGPWNPFRNKMTGVIVAARWDNVASSWEVAGQEERVSSLDASQNWVFL